MNQFSLKGKTALLTGAAGFFGKYFARALLENRIDQIIMIDRKEEELRGFCGKLNKELGERRVFGYAQDFYDNQALNTKNFYESISKIHPINVLINNAFDFSSRTGFNTPEGRLENATYDQFVSCFEAGVYWAFKTTQIFGQIMKKCGGGVIINIGTMYAQYVPNPSLYEGTQQFNPWGYSASKGALLQFTRYTAAWLAPEVRVNMLSPGAIPNTENQKTNNPPDPRVSERLLNKIILKRMGHPTDLTGALIFLASDASRYITGQNICIDGGITVTVT